MLLDPYSCASTVDSKHSVLPVGSGNQEAKHLQNVGGDRRQTVALLEVLVKMKMRPVTGFERVNSRLVRRLSGGSRMLKSIK
jgi:hypothetical protein